MINDLWNIQMGVIGICVSVITLLYSSLSTKVEEVKSIKDSKEYSLMNKKTALENSINTLRKANKQVIIGLISFSILFVFSTILKYMSINILCWLIGGDAILTIIMLTYCIYLSYSIYSQYQKET